MQSSQDRSHLCGPPATKNQAVPNQYTKKQRNGTISQQEKSIGDLLDQPERKLLQPKENSVRNNKAENGHRKMQITRWKTHGMFLRAHPITCFILNIEKVLEVLAGKSLHCSKNDLSRLKQDKHILRAYNITPIKQEWLQEFYKSSYD